MQPKSQNEADIRIDIEGLCFRTDAQFEYIQRLTELEPDFSQTEVGNSNCNTDFHVTVDWDENIDRLPSPGTEAGWVSAAPPGRRRSGARRQCGIMSRWTANQSPELHCYLLKLTNHMPELLRLIKNQSPVKVLRHSDWETHLITSENKIQHVFNPTDTNLINAGRQNWEVMGPECSWHQG